MATAESTKLKAKTAFTAATNSTPSRCSAHWRGGACLDYSTNGPQGRQGDRVVVSCWVKAVTNPWPMNLRAEIATRSAGWGPGIWGQFNGGLPLISSGPSDGHPHLVPGRWIPLVAEGEWTSANGGLNGTIGQIAISILDFSMVTPLPACEILVDAVQVRYDSGRHRSTDWLLPGVAQPNEYATAGMTAGTAWTVFFDWYPDAGHRELKAAENLAIASVVGPTGHVDLWWDNAGKAFAFGDGVDGYATAGGYAWKHFDRFKFALSSTGADTTLYVHDPTQGTVKVVGTGVGTGEAPTALRLGANAALTLWGAGRYSNTRQSARAYSEAEVLAAWTAAGTGANRGLLSADAARGVGMIVVPGLGSGIGIG